MIALNSGVAVVYTCVVDIMIIVNATILLQVVNFVIMELTSTTIIQDSRCTTLAGFLRLKFQTNIKLQILTICYTWKAPTIIYHVLCVDFAEPAKQKWGGTSQPNNRIQCHAVLL